MQQVEPMLRRTTRYVGSPKQPINQLVLRPQNFEAPNRGGWKDRKTFQREYLAWVKKWDRPFGVSIEKTERGVRIAEPLAGACEGVTRIEEIEID